MRKSELLSVAEIRKWEEDTMAGVNDTKKTKNNISEIQDYYTSKTPIQTAKDTEGQELRKWIVGILYPIHFKEDTATEIIMDCKVIENYILGNDNARL
jgi:hypothetical protein